MICVPHDFKPLLSNMVATIGKSATAQRLVLFSTAAVLTIGDRTVLNVLRLLSLIDSVNLSTYHRVFSHRRWSSRSVACAISRFVIDRWAPAGVIRVCGDETVDGHRGKNVYGKARHRDAVRSSHFNTVFRYGHKWIVLLPKPKDVVAKSKKQRLRVRWYGGGWRIVEYVTGTGHWYKSGKSLVPVRWVFVRDKSGTHRDEYFFTTDLSLSAKVVVEKYGARWNIETTFQEMRSQLGLETTRGWSKQTVLRMAPLLFCLYTPLSGNDSCQKEPVSSCSTARIIGYQRG